MRVLTNEEIKSRQWLCMKNLRVPAATRRWHEGCEALGYWAEGDSFVFKLDGHYFCITRGFVEKVAAGEVEFSDEAAD